jgi:tetratricopeptide (TPR) repeat protein
MTPKTDAAAYAKAEAFLKAGDTLSAERIYRDLAVNATAERTLPLGLAIGSCLARRRLWADAKTHFETLVAQFPDSGEARSFLGATKVELADFDGGRDDLDQAIAMSPGEGIVFIKRGELYHRLGLLRQAEADYQAALLLHLPDDYTRDFGRRALLNVRAELKTVIERKAPPLPDPRNLFRRFRNSESSEPLQSVPVGRST